MAEVSVTDLYAPLTRHRHGDGCPGPFGGHYRADGSRCVHRSWVCENCHDDPPAGHRCPACGVTAPGIAD